MTGNISPRQQQQEDIAAAIFGLVVLVMIICSIVGCWDMKRTVKKIAPHNEGTIKVFVYENPHFLRRIIDSEKTSVFYRKTLSNDKYQWHYDNGELVNYGPIHGDLENAFKAYELLKPIEKKEPD